MKKRVLTILLLFSFVLPIITPAYAADQAEPAVDEDTAYAEAISLFEGLNLFGDDISYFEGESVSRAHLAELLYDMLGLQDISQEAARHYQDVKASHESYKEIESVSAQFLMAGNGEQLFRPDEPATYNEAIKTMICAIGYQPLAEVQGGYPTGYLAVASSKKLLLSIQMKSGAEAISGRDLAVLLYQTLDVSMMKEYGYGEADITAMESDVNILWDAHRITVTEAVVEADEKASLYGDEPCREGYMLLDGILYHADSIFNALGYRVDAYVQDTDGDDKADTILYVQMLANKHRTLTIGADDLNSYDTLTYVYGDGKRARISKETQILYNGKQMTQYDETLMVPSNGYIELISNDGDDVYDVLFIHDQSTIAVNQISVENGFITDLYDDGKALRVDLENDSIQVSVYEGNSNEITFEQIQQGDVLTVETSQDGTCIAIYRSSEKVNGTLEEIMNDDGVMIDGVEYDTVPGVLAAADFEIGAAATFLLDMYGKVAGAQDEIGSQWLYGIVLDVVASGKLTPEVQVKMFTQNNMEKIYDIAARVTVDGRKVDEGETADNGTNFVKDALEAQEINLIRFRCNAAEEMDEIDTLYHAAEYGESKETLYQMVERGRRGYNASIYSFSAKMNVGSNTVMFRINPTPTGIVEEDYEVISRTSLIGNEVYDVEGYAHEEDAIVPDVILVHDAGSGTNGISDTAKWMVVSNVGNSMDEAGNIYDSVTGIWGGYEQRVLFSDDVQPSGLQPGDIIRFGQNGDGFIRAYEKVFDAQSGELAYGSNPYPPGSGFGADYVAAMAYVWRSKDGQMVVTYDESELGETWPENAYIWNIASAPVYIYEKNGRGEATLRVGRKEDLIGYDKDAANPSKILFNAHWSVITEIYIIK